MHDIAVLIHHQGNLSFSRSNGAISILIIEFSCGRYNKGQSPLLLRRNLLEYGNNQVSPSPMMPRRWIYRIKYLNIECFFNNFVWLSRFRYISASPPLPPPRKSSESVPNSPQQLRARIHYTPEPQRRIYRTIDQWVGLQVLAMWLWYGF